MRSRDLSAALLVVLLGVQPAVATSPQAQKCSRAEFEAVVDAAGASLRALTQKMKPRFQEKLRKLRDKHRWTHEQFMEKAVPYVRDPEIARFDRTTADLLASITSLGEEGAAQKQENCVLLQTLRGHMDSLMRTTEAKWAYMFAKIDKELARPAGQ
ncbi:MAG: hypothetical protein KDJ41_03140 [Hyphomicrobiaceae bacterium]|nr:hypothetical protein [Hyphomicrobiaceae bacterium]